jgi:glycosyltransferase involved in cell wall biosynthesis
MPSPSRLKVLLLIPHLGGGGAEHVAEMLAHFLDRAKYELHLGLITKAASNSTSLSGVTVHQLNTSRIRFSILKIKRLIWSVRPDVILSGMAHLNLLILLLRPALPGGIRILVRQNGELSAILSAGPLLRFSRCLYGVAYRRAHLIIAQSQAMKEEIKREFRIDEGRIVVLPNPVDTVLIRNTMRASDHGRRLARIRLIAVGRLVPEKGFDLLLGAFASILDRGFDAELLIAGSGFCEASLKRQAENLGIANRVQFCGHVANPVALFRDVPIFVLSSRTEGIPNVLLEAAAAGLPIVSTPASGGLANLVAGREGVWLASEVSTEALRAAVESALQEIVPGRRYEHSWIEPFDVGHSIPAYEAMIDHCVEAPAN